MYIYVSVYVHVCLYMCTYVYLHLISPLSVLTCTVYVQMHAQGGLGIWVSCWRFPFRSVLVVRKRIPGRPAHGERASLRMSQGVSRNAASCICTAVMLQYYSCYIGYWLQCLRN